MFHPADTERSVDPEELERQAEQAGPVERVELLTRAVGAARNPLERLRLLMLVSDAAGRAAHHVAGKARDGAGMPEGRC
ncbi:hypothetical protein EBN88_05350 [Streptomyces triticirhizae]|uniref:Uncharacterized protein n=1 Tax=Streptomyces triticirhizae TaxID=2483353 RepID=A0A3M2M439_9ACTN|nr:hypothetical protein EBN88_05350 [Streptomyces triticirhizae]